jgi:hypothetical protein
MLYQAEIVIKEGAAAGSKKNRQDSQEQHTAQEQAP